MIVVSYYTKNTGYEKEVQNLIASLKKFNLPFDIKGIENLGSWLKNCQYKLFFVREMLEKHREPVLFLDADAVVRQFPALLIKTDADFAVHLMGERLLSGTMYFSQNPVVKNFIEACIETNRREPHIYEQTAIENTLPSWKNKMKVLYLPFAYCQIFDHKNAVSRPVIEHFQASRRFKKII